MAKIEKRGDKYTTRLSLTDKVTGRRTMARVTARTKRELEREVARVRAEFDAGDRADASLVTVAEAVTGWLRDGDVRDSTALQYETLARVHILNDEIATMVVSRMRRGQVEDWISRKRAAGHAPRHVRMMYRVLTAACERLVRREEIRRNPCTGVGNLPSVPRRDPQALSREEVATLLAGIRGDRYEALLTIAVMLGLRRGELLALRWTDVDLERATLTVNRSLTRVRTDAGWRWVVGDEPKTPYSRRTIELPLTCQAILRRHQAEQARRVELAGLPPAVAVFDRGDGQHYLRPEPVDHRFRQLATRLGLPDWVTLHSLRHTAATHMLWRGIPAPSVAQVLGHRDATVTLQVYAHVLHAMQSEAAGLIEGMYGTESTQIVPNPDDAPENWRPYAVSGGR